MKKSNFVRTIILAGSLLLQLGTLCFLARGAAGDVDLSFDPGSGVNGAVNAVVVQPDGKVIIGGEFTTVKGLVRYGIARLNADGSGDSSFEMVGISGVDARAIDLQPDGKVLVGYSGGICRLNANGILDTNYANLNLGILNSIILQADGKALVGGNVATLSGDNWNFGVARLNANGSLDTNFNAGQFSTYTWDTYIYSLAVQVDGKVIVVGYLSTLNGTNVSYGITRLNTNGTLDSTFNPGRGADTGSDVRSVIVQSDGQVLIGGSFSSVNGTNCYGIARLNSNGSLENSFNVGITNNSNVYSMVLQPDDKVLISGERLKRFNADGTLDSTFTPGFYQSYGLALQTDGKVIVGAARLHADGGFDNNFHVGRGGSALSSVVLQPDGKVLIGGLYTFINGTNRYGSARLNADGSFDSTATPSSFNPDLAAMIPSCPPGANCFPEVKPATLLVQPDGNVLIGGHVNSLECYNVEGGSCFTYGRYFLSRLNADGSPDSSFEPATGDKKEFTSDKVLATAVQPDGKILMAGIFSSVKGTNRTGIARLNPNGSLDPSFNAVNFPLNVHSVALQSDGKVLIGGDFSYDSFTNRNRIARLNTDGSLDSSFNPGIGPNATVQLITLQPDGKFLIGGAFTNVAGTTRNRIARLNANGSLDSSFNPGSGINGGAPPRIASITLQPDGKIIIGGDFLTVNGVLRPYVARLYGDSVIIPSLNIARSNTFVIVSWPANATGYSLQESTTLLLANSWSPVAQPAVTNAGQIFVTVPTTVGQKFFRLKMQ